MHSRTSRIGVIYWVVYSNIAFHTLLVCSLNSFVHFNYKTGCVDSIKCITQSIFCIHDCVNGIITYIVYIL